ASLRARPAPVRPVPAGPQHDRDQDRGADRDRGPRPGRGGGDPGPLRRPPRRGLGPGRDVDPGGQLLHGLAQLGPGVRDLVAQRPDLLLVVPVHGRPPVHTSCWAAAPRPFGPTRARGLRIGSVGPGIPAVLRPVGLPRRSRTAAAIASRSARTLRLTSSGRAGVACRTCRRPSIAMPPAITSSTTATISAANQAGSASASASTATATRTPTPYRASR